MDCYLIDHYSVDWLIQLSMAVGEVRIVRPVVDYESYLCHEADSHSEGLSVVSQYRSNAYLYDYLQTDILASVLCIS